MTRPSDSVNNGSCIDNFYIKNNKFNHAAIKLDTACNDH